MKLKNMPKEELELLSYTDLTNLLLKEKGKSMNTPTIFKEICNLLGFSDEQYMEKIGDYYTSLTIDKRFILLDNHEWDLRERHAVKLDLDEEDEDENELNEEEDSEEEEEIEDDIETPLDDEELDDMDDDMDDLSIVDEDEEEEENL